MDYARFDTRLLWQSATFASPVSWRSRLTFEYSNADDGT
jgi:hypothetical protein